MTRRVTLLLALVALAGCGKRTEYEPQLTPAARTVEPNERSIAAIASERCDREKRCNTIGPDGRFESYEACFRKLNDAAYDSLGPGQCRSGFDQAELNECLQAIRAEDCNSPLDTLERVAACRSAELCLDW